MVISAVIFNLISGAHNSYNFNVSLTLQKLIDAMLHLDATPLAPVFVGVLLLLGDLPGSIVGDRSVPDEAGVVCYVWVVLDLVF